MRKNYRGQSKKILPANSWVTSHLKTYWGKQVALRTFSLSECFLTKELKLCYNFLILRKFKKSENWYCLFRKNNKKKRHYNSQNVHILIVLDIFKSNQEWTFLKFNKSKHFISFLIKGHRGKQYLFFFQLVAYEFPPGK